MARTTLEINVFDEIKVADSLKKAIIIVLEAFKKWVSSTGEKPFELRIKKISNKSPPTLEIKVKEDIVVKSAFGK